jgi:hypothetical protein
MVQRTNKDPISSFAVFIQQMQYCSNSKDLSDTVDDEAAGEGNEHIQYTIEVDVTYKETMYVCTSACVRK